MSNILPTINDRIFDEADSLISHYHFGSLTDNLAALKDAAVVVGSILEPVAPVASAEEALRREALDKALSITGVAEGGTRSKQLTHHFNTILAILQETRSPSLEDTSDTEAETS